MSCSKFECPLFSFGVNLVHRDEVNCRRVEGRDGKPGCFPMGRLMDPRGQESDAKSPINGCLSRDMSSVRLALPENWRRYVHPRTSNAALIRSNLRYTIYCMSLQVTYFFMELHALIV